ncbi:MAG: TRAP transporter substrate-binding protein DctP [Treponema sp.]|nr:TRAP transporter substrate-binding protein DctP [Treponema sp.]
MKVLVNFRLSFVVLILLVLVSPVFAQRVMEIKLSSLVPENTPWGQSINRLAAEWSRITNGQIVMKVFHGGTAGGEAQTMALLRSNQLQAAVLTTMGLGTVTPELMSVSYPFLIRDDAELEEVMRRIKPDLEVKMQQNGFVTLAWANAGWVKLFARSPVFTPDDLRKVKLGSSQEQPELMQAFRQMGYQVVPAELNEVIMAMQSGRIDVTYISPVFAAGTQVFGVAKNMSSINVAPFMGGILMNEVTWRRVPERFKPALLEACKNVEKEIETTIAKLDSDALTTMVRHGLIVHQLTPAQNQIWYDETDRYEERMIGGVKPIFNREYYFRIKNILTEIRKGK